MFGEGDVYSPLARHVRCKVGEAFRAYEVFEALHGDRYGFAVIHEYEELASLFVSETLCLADGTFLAPVEDVGADEF